MKKDDEGRAVIDCTTLLQGRAAFLAEVVEVGGEQELEVEPLRVVVPVREAELVRKAEGVAEEKEEEAFVAALDIKLLHKRVRHLRKGGMERLAREGLVTGLEGGMSGEMDLCTGCELSRPRPHPHHRVDPVFWSTRPLELVHADLVGPIRVQSWGGAKYMFVLVDD